MDARALRARVAALRLPIGDYAVFGSGLLLAHGLVPFVNDVDVLARGAAWEAATRLGDRGGGGEPGRPARRGRGRDLRRLARDADGAIDGAEIAWGLPFARLEDVPAFKRLLERPKDREHVRLIRTHLGNEARGGGGPAHPRTAGPNTTGVRYS